MFSFSARAVEDIVKFTPHLKASVYWQPCLSTTAPGRINQSADNWNCLFNL